MHQSPSDAKRLTRQLIWVIGFSVAMGFLEAAVVIYLRELYYPTGFQFPLVPMQDYVGLVEIFREAATVVMLIGVGVLAGRNASQRVAFFLLSFAIWDLFYYAFLKVVLDWPSSWFTWDILFLIPAPWIGPVLSAVIAALTMVGYSGVILWQEFQGRPKKINPREWLVISAGSFVVIISWMWDYVKYSGRVVDVSQNALKILSTYVPDHYNWWIFAAGEFLLMTAIFLHWRRKNNS